MEIFYKINTKNLTKSQIFLKIFFILLNLTILLYKLTPPTPTSQTKSPPRPQPTLTIT
jgi:hypothetical protein